MADSFITQVERPAESNPRPARKPKLKLELDANGNPLAGGVSAVQAAQAEEEQKSPDVDNRSTGLGKIFSRQFTPTVPKTNFFADKENRAGAQSPRNLAQSPKAGGGGGGGLATTHEDDENGEDESGSGTGGGAEASPTNVGGKKTIWQSIRSCFVSDTDAQAYNAAAASRPEPPMPAAFNSPRGQGKAIDFDQMQQTSATAGVASPPPASLSPRHIAEEQYVSDDPEALLPPNPTNKKMCLVLDLDETLVHSSFKPVPSSDFILSIEMDGVTHKVYVLKRPGVDEFLKKMAEYFELVIFTASLDKYANPLLDLLDKEKLITSRLYREHCTRQGQTYVKDLGRLGRRVNHSLIIDNSPYSYAMHINYAVPILSWFDDPHDTELLDMIPFLKNLTKLDDVSEVLDANRPWRVTNKKLIKLLTERGESVYTD